MGAYTTQIRINEYFFDIDYDIIDNKIQIDAIQNSTAIYRLISSINPGLISLLVEQISQQVVDKIEKFRKLENFLDEFNLLTPNDAKLFLEEYIESEISTLNNVSSIKEREFADTYSQKETKGEI